MRRRKFINTTLLAGASLSLPSFISKPKYTLMTVNGPIDASKAGNILSHEHILVDFIGALSYDPGRWDRNEVVRSLLPHLTELRRKGCDTMIECTPAYLGRDVHLLKKLSEMTGLNIITNTGFYGARDNKFLPELIYETSAEDIAAVWIDEFENGIENTGARPGFMKISVNPDPLSEIHQKLVTAAALTHLKTGLTIASHTGPAIPAFQQIEMIKKHGVDPSAFVWIHAQNEGDISNHLKAGKMGCWVSFDGLDEEHLEDYVSMLINMKDGNVLNRVLISHDAGWYEPDKPWEGLVRKYTVWFDSMVPKLKEAGFTKEEIKELIHFNPMQAFGVHVRKIQ